jgi:hypothetical protein
LTRASWSHRTDRAADLLCAACHAAIRSREEREVNAVGECGGRRERWYGASWQSAGLSPRAAVHSRQAKSDSVRRFTDLGANRDRADLAIEVPTATKFDRILAGGNYGVECIDALNSLMLGVNRNQSNEVLPRLRPYIEVIRRHNAAGCIVAHASKGRCEHIDSDTIGGLGDALLALEDPRRSRDKISAAETEADNAAPENGIRLLQGSARFDQKLHEWVSAPGGLHCSRGKNAMTLEARILRALADGDAPSIEEPAKRLWMRKDAVGKVEKQLIGRGRIARRDRGLTLVRGSVPG